MLQLNVELQYRDMPSPNRAAVVVRSAARSLKAAVKFFSRRVKRCRAVETEAGVGEEKTEEKVLEEYRQTLQNTFGSSERIDDVIKSVKVWIYEM